MSEISSFKQVIGLWPSADAMAAEIGATAASARKWLWRDSIPAEWWKAVTEAGPAKDAGVTAELLADLAARRLDPANALVEVRI